MGTNESVYIQYLKYYIDVNVFLLFPPDTTCFSLHPVDINVCRLHGI